MIHSYNRLDVGIWGLVATRPPRIDHHGGCHRGGERTLDLLKSPFPRSMRLVGKWHACGKFAVSTRAYHGLGGEKSLLLGSGQVAPSELRGGKRGRVDGCRKRGAAEWCCSEASLIPWQRRGSCSLSCSLAAFPCFADAKSDSVPIGDGWCDSDCCTSRQYLRRGWGWEAAE